MDYYNQPNILELRYYCNPENTHYVFTGRSYYFSKHIEKNIATVFVDLVETSNYIGAITFAIRDDKITYMELDVETMLLEDGEQYPKPKEILERIQRALGNLQIPPQLTIKAETTYVSVVLDKHGD